MKIINSFKYAVSGIIYAVKNEGNLKFHILAMSLVLICGALLRFSRLEMIVLLFTCTFVIIAEMLNTAVEKLTDYISPEKSDAAKIAKDVAAGSVLVSAISAVVVAVILFLRPWVIKLVLSYLGF